MTAIARGTRRATNAIMRRGIIILFTVLSAASVALGLAVRTESGWGTNKGRISKDGTHWTYMISVSLGKGVVSIGYQKTLDGSQVSRCKQTNWPWWQYTVIVFVDPSNERYYQHWGVTVSSEVPLTMGVVFGVYPTFALLRGPVRRRRRRRHGLCTNCGYNLTGNVSGVCPECGAPILVQRRRS